MGTLEIGINGRILVGNCPACGRVLVVINNGEVWPLVRCPCQWEAPTGDLLNHHLVERVRVEPRRA